MKCSQSRAASLHRGILRLCCGLPLAGAHFECVLHRGNPAVDSGQLPVVHKALGTDADLPRRAPREGRVSAFAGPSPLSAGRGRGRAAGQNLELAPGALEDEVDKRPVVLLRGELRELGAAPAIRQDPDNA